VESEHSSVDTVTYLLT